MGILTLLALSLPMFAHHGNAAYDMTERTMKDVTITKFAWANPHCIVQFDAKDASGKSGHWAAELGSPSAIGLVGFTKSSLNPGDVVTLFIHLSKTGNNVGRITRIQFPDGSVLPHPGTSYSDDLEPGSGRAGRGSSY